MLENTGSVEQRVVHHLLLVDDEPPQVWLLTRILKKVGYEVTGFHDANQALEAFRQNPCAYDAVISDLCMPGFSGFDLARSILEVRADIPVVLTTGYVREEDQALADEIGVRQLLLKGHTISELGTALQSILEKPQC